MDTHLLLTCASLLGTRRVGGDASGKTFRAFDPDQVLLLPPSLDDWLPETHLARFIADLVDEHLDLSAFYAAYDHRRGAPPYDLSLLMVLGLAGR